DRRELGDRGAQLADLVARRGALVGAGRVGRMRERVLEARLRVAAPKTIGDDVARDRVEEREERTTRFVPRHRDERALEDFAGHVLGLRSGAHTEERVAVNGTDMQVV